MRTLYYQELRRRISELETRWQWAVPFQFGWIDDEGQVVITSRNHAARALRESAARREPEDSGD